MLLHNRTLVSRSHEKIDYFQKIISIWQDGWPLMAHNVTYFARLSSEANVQIELATRLICEGVSLKWIWFMEKNRLINSLGPFGSHLKCIRSLWPNYPNHTPAACPGCLFTCSHRQRSGAEMQKKEGREDLFLEYSTAFHNITYSEFAVHSVL